MWDMRVLSVCSCLVTENLITAQVRERSDSLLPSRSCSCNKFITEEEIDPQLEPRRGRKQRGEFYIGISWTGCSLSCPGQTPETPVLIVTRLIDETSDQTQSVGDSVVRCIVICSGVSTGWSLSHFQDTSTSDTSTSDLMWYDYSSRVKVMECLSASRKLPRYQHIQFLWGHWHDVYVESVRPILHLIIIEDTQNVNV